MTRLSAAVRTLHGHRTQELFTSWFIRRCRIQSPLNRISNGRNGPNGDQRLHCGSLRGCSIQGCCALNQTRCQLIQCFHLLLNSPDPGNRLQPCLDWHRQGLIAPGRFSSASPAVAATWAYTVRATSDAVRLSVLAVPRVGKGIGFSPASPPKPESSRTLPSRERTRMVPSERWVTKTLVFCSNSSISAFR